MRYNKTIFKTPKSYFVFTHCKECGEPLFNAFIRNDGYAICQDCHIKHVIKEVVNN